MGIIESDLGCLKVSSTGKEFVQNKELATKFTVNELKEVYPDIEEWLRSKKCTYIKISEC